jgi:hypothetical protein
MDENAIFFSTNSVADPGPGSGAFLTPGSGIRDGKKSDPGWKKVGSGMNIPDPQHCLQIKNFMEHILRIAILEEFFVEQCRENLAVSLLHQKISVHLKRYFDFFILLHYFRVQLCIPEVEG